MTKNGNVTQEPNTQTWCHQYMNNYAQKYYIYIRELSNKNTNYKLVQKRESRKSLNARSSPRFESVTVARDSTLNED